MFDLITGSTERPLREQSPRSKLVAIAVHLVVLAGIVGISWRVVQELPPDPTRMVFLAPPAPDLPAPPPPPPPPPARRLTPPEPRPPAERVEEIPAPVEPSSEVPAEPLGADTGAAPQPVVEGGVSGGVEGGMAGGTIGGLESALAAPPEPAPAPAPSGPVRIGGKVSAPQLVHRVDPIYPNTAAALNLHGVVILEATVDTTGCVTSVKVLRSQHRILDNAAIDALKQWRYAPLMLNRIPVPFVLTVTFTFRIP